MKTLIILHGWQSSGSKWQKVKEKIENSSASLGRGGIRVLAPDIPGFKSESELNRPWVLDDYINWFEDFVMQSKLEYPDIANGFYLLGHSFGGRMTIKIAAKKIFKLNGVILVSAAGIKRNQAFYAPAIGFAAKIVKAFKLGDKPTGKNLYNFLRIFFYRYVIQKTDYLNAKGNLNETIKNILAEDLKEILPFIDERVKIIWGRKDKITPLSDAYLMQEKIPNSELHILEQTGHMPYLDCPNELAESILEFIKY